MQAPQDDVDNTSGLPRTLQDQAAEFSRLQHENFNLKMRIDFLEELMLRLKRGEMVFGDEKVGAQVDRLRSELEQRDHQLAEQAARATRANDVLTEQLRAAQAELDHREAQVGQKRRRPSSDPEGHVGVDAGTLQHLRAGLEKAVQAEEQSRRRVKELGKSAEILHSELKELRGILARERRTAEQRKQRCQLTMQHMKRERDNALAGLDRVRSMRKTKDELMMSLLQRVEAERQEKQKLRQEYVERLQTINDDTMRKL